MKNTGSWHWPTGKKEKGEITAERAVGLDAGSGRRAQASGAMHVDPGTKDYKYSRTEVEALIAITAAS